MPLPNVTAGVPTRLRLGSWNTLTDAFQAHTSSPTGAIIDLNDGVNWSLADDDAGFGTGLDWGHVKPTLYTTKNPRTVGERVTRRQYDTNRTLKVKLVLGQFASYTAFQTALDNLAKTLEGISPSQPAALEIRPVQSSTSVYADCTSAWLEKDDYRETLWNQLISTGIEVNFFCSSPFLRGARQTLSNLAVNPGFEAPIGGSQAPAVVAFQDTFANVNAYAVQAGGAPTVSPAKTYVDIVLGDAPLLFWPMSEASTPTPAYDIAGQGKSATAGGSGTTIGAAGGISGDTSTAWSFNGSGYATFPAATTTGLPTGNGAWTIEAWVKFAANPGALAVVASFGAQATGHGGPQIYINTSGQPAATNDVGPDAVGTALSLNVWHHVVGTWDGTNMRVWQDGTNSASTTPGAATIPNPPTYGTIAGSAAAAPTMLFTGSVQMVAIYGTALSAAQITAHYNAGHTGATGTVANAMSLPAAGRAAFGSPAWGAMQTWQTRFRWVSGLTATFYLHYTDANNNLAVSVASGTNGLQIVHTVSGVAHAQQQATVTLTHEAWYWLQVTQFPTVPGNPPYLTATLSYDSGGAVGAQIAQLAAAAYDAVTAEVGRPQLAAAGAALAVGGVASGAGNQVALFGPGGWLFQGNGAAGLCSGAWDGGNQQVGTSSNGSANTYPNGPVTSFGAARIDLPPAGAVDAKWRLYTGGAPAGTWALPVKAAFDTLFAGANIKSSGLGNGATIKIDYTEYDTNGTSLRSGTLATFTVAGGVQAAYAATGAYTLSGSWATGASCAYADVALHVADTVAGNSANGIVWLDNVLVYDQTATGQTGAAGMPWCDLRGPSSPYQVVVSGLQGDVPAPCALQFATYIASFPHGSSFTFKIGRSAGAARAARFVAPVGSMIYGTPAWALDATAYGGYVPAAGQLGGYVAIAFPAVDAATYTGTYRLLCRAKTTQATFGKVFLQSLYVQYSGGKTYPFAAANQWTPVDLGYLPVPNTPQGALNDPTVAQGALWINYQDTNAGSPSTGYVNWEALLPVDGSLLTGTIYNGNTIYVPNYDYSNSWVWVYGDGLLAQQGKPASWTTSIETSAYQQEATDGAGGPANPTNAGISGGSITDSYLTVDPTVRPSGGTVSANLLVAIISDSAANAYPFVCDLAYSPLYLIPQ